MNRLPLLAAVAALAAAALAAVTCGGPPAAPPPPPAPLPVFVPPLHDAVVGEEIVLRRVNSKREWRWLIVSVTGTSVEVEIQEYRDGEPAGALNRQAWLRNLNGLVDDELALVVRSISRDRIDVAGQSWDCWVIHAQGSGQSRWFWVTDKLPVHGLLRLAVDTQGKGVPNLADAIEYVPPR